MSSLLLKFGIRLESDDLITREKHHGPFFHRWLPNGVSNALTLPTDSPEIEFKVWFERRGSVQNGVIQFSYDKREIDPQIIPEQDALDVGPLMGTLRLKEVSEDKLIPILNNDTGNKIYIDYAKEIIDSYLFPNLTKLISIFKFVFGQYWIGELEKWDFRNMTIGAYCINILNLKWSTDEGASWHDFLPDKPMSYGTVYSYSDTPYKELLEEDDWNRIPSYF